MSRIVDEPYFTHSAYSAFTTGIQVKCPKCHGTGVVTADDDNAYFRCLSGRNRPLSLFGRTGEGAPDSGAVGNIAAVGGCRADAGASHVLL